MWWNGVKTEEEAEENDETFSVFWFSLTRSDQATYSSLSTICMHIGTICCKNTLF